MKNRLSLDYFRIRKLRKIIKKINDFSELMTNLSDWELRAKTEEFKQRLSDGQSVDSLLIESFAVVREATKRVLGLYPYEVQLLGGIVIHYGNLAEMKTGEGKTLTATLPLYLNALSGRGSYLVTPNAYLAERDGEEMRSVFEFLGLSVGIRIGDTSDRKLTVEEKRKIYYSDIIYTTHSALGFDYLIDNLAPSLEKKFMRPLHFAIIDEADEVLLDSALTPLIISGAPRLQSNLYGISNLFIMTLSEGKDYIYEPEKKEIWLTSRGIDQAENFFSLKNLYEPYNIELVRHINLSLRAHKLFKKDKEYLLFNDKVTLLDKSNGRMLDMTKLQGGLHQAIEAKENAKITDEMRAMASITYQNLFLIFDKIGGMTGTGKTAEEEFIDVYNMEVIRIPTNKPIQRQDRPDKIYTTLPEKIKASIDFIKKVNATGQPVLLITGSVRMSELYSELLLYEGISHNLLNAHNEVKEAQMISEAGQLGAVTVATNMAGRGTDIKITDEVRSLGGLAVIGAERMNNERMDLQIKGRAGRQGDPGFSQFFISLEDELVTNYGPKWVLKYFKKHILDASDDSPRELKQRRFKRMLQHAQNVSESQGRVSRKTTLEFDESVKIQRNYIYDERNAILNNDTTRFDVLQICQNAVEDFLRDNKQLNVEILNRFILDAISYDFKNFPSDLDISDREEVKDYLMFLIKERLKQKSKISGKHVTQFYQLSVLKAIDEAWVEEVDYLQQLRGVVQSRQYAQRNTTNEYHKEAMISYAKMKKDIRYQSLQNLMLSKIGKDKEGKFKVTFV